MRPGYLNPVNRMSFFGCIGILFALFTLTIVAFSWTLACTNRASHAGVVETTYVKRVSDQDHFFVAVRCDDGETRIFAIEDSLWNWRFDSADVYVTVKVGDRVEVNSAGYRSNFWSMFPNALKVRVVK